MNVLKMYAIDAGIVCNDEIGCIFRKVYAPVPFRSEVRFPAGMTKKFGRGTILGQKLGRGKSLGEVCLLNKGLAMPLHKG